MSDALSQKTTDAEMCAAFLDEAELVSDVIPLLDSHARKLCCIRCALDDFQEPGMKGWGVRGCGESVSVSPEEANDSGKKKFSKPFKCFFCRGPIGYSVPYFRIAHPLDGTNPWNCRLATTAVD